jgi:FMN reductase
VHALRGWPTPLGAAVNSAHVRFGADGDCSDDQVAATLRTIGLQVVEFATSRV